MKDVREIIKLSEEEEFDMFSLSGPDKMEKLLKSLRTAQTLGYWEVPEKDNFNRGVYKGASMILGLILECSAANRAIRNATTNPDEQMKAWRGFKKQHRTK